MSHGRRTIGFFKKLFGGGPEPGEDARSTRPPGPAGPSSRPPPQKQSRAPGLREAPTWMHEHVAPNEDPARCREDVVQRLDAAIQGGNDVGDRAFFERLRRYLDSEDLDLPPFPRVCMEMNRLLAEGDADAADVVHLVDQEPALIKSVWRRASAPVYGHRPDSLRSAVMRLGFNELWRISMAVCLQRGVFRARGFQEQAEAARLHGIIAADVATWFGNGPLGPLYLAGLLHDVGKLVIYRAAGAHPTDPPRPAAVERAIRRYHPALGLLVAHCWGLGPEVEMACGYHHAPEKAPRSGREAALLVRIADIAAHTVVASDPDVRQAGKVGLIDLRLERKSPAEVLERAEQALRRAAGDFEPSEEEERLVISDEPQVPEAAGEDEMIFDFEAEDVGAEELDGGALADLGTNAEDATGAPPLPSDAGN